MDGWTDHLESSAKPDQGRCVRQPKAQQQPQPQQPQPRARRKKKRQRQQQQQPSAPFSSKQRNCRKQEGKQQATNNIRWENKKAGTSHTHTNFHTNDSHCPPIIDYISLSLCFSLPPLFHHDATSNFIAAAGRHRSLPIYGNSPSLFPNWIH